MCTGFTSINEAYSKDCYPLPNIDRIGRNMEIYVDAMIIKSREADEHEANRREIFDNMRRYKLQLNPDKCVFGVSSGKFLGYIISQRGIEPNTNKIGVVQAMQSPITQKEAQRLTGKMAALTQSIYRAGDRSLPFFKAFKKGK
ncbi:hypothetical protein LIER_37107 [Lithospermum erythrorhizon]|uniref:Reverse transcriptase domain-containing protein n=1 Tax=Lithospermum erythrorhizon TaxID=34254 RepID=A0AAV3PGI7_LITER